MTNEAKHRVGIIALLGFFLYFAGVYVLSNIEEYTIKAHIGVHLFLTYAEDLLSSYTCISWCAIGIFVQWPAK